MDDRERLRRLRAAPMEFDLGGHKYIVQILKVEAALEWHEKFWTLVGDVEGLGKEAGREAESIRSDRYALPPTAFRSPDFSSCLDTFTKSGGVPFS